ncbi:Arginine-hydroxylase NDUFAF5, mitochondrial [Schistosoma japonicum]|nr:Arginine-hydroxylase NDUFAF5, mitochondrial [Schistosoma japonicum]
MSLHWINDLPDLLRQILTCLRNDGCLLGVMPATDTLYELRVSLQLAELERLGGISSHISPFVDSVDMADLLQCAGFNLITLDIDEIVIHYPNMFALMNDLRFMGESNATVHRPLRLNRDVLIAASAIYNEKFSVPRVDYEAERCIPATYRLLFFIGWKPDPSQSKPLPRGSAQHSLKDLHRIDELARLHLKK